MKIDSLNKMEPKYENPRIESFSRMKGSLQIKSTTSFWGSSTRFFQIFAHGRILAVFNVHPDEFDVPEDFIIVSKIQKVSEIKVDEDTVFKIQLPDRSILLNSEEHPTNEDWIIALEYLRTYYKNDSQYQYMSGKKEIDQTIICTIAFELEQELWESRLRKKMDFSLFIKAKNLKCFTELQPGVKNRVFIAQATVKSRVFKVVQNKELGVKLKGDRERRSQKGDRYDWTHRIFSVCKSKNGISG